MNRRWTAVLGSTMVLLLAVAGCAVADSPVTVVIAADLELSGSMARLGNVYRQALELRVDQLNRSGTLGSRRLELRVTDNRSDPTVALADIGQIVEDPEVDAVITGQCAACVITSAKAINSAGLPAISLAVPSGVTEPLADRQYIFKIAPDLTDDVDQLVGRFAADGLSTVAIVASDDDYGHEGAEALAALAPRHGIDVDTVRYLGASGGDLAGTAHVLTQSHPDAVVMFAFAPLASDIGAAVRATGYQKPLYLDAGAADHLYVSAQEASALNGAYMVFPSALVSEDVIATSPARSARRAWLRDFTSAYGSYAAFSSFAADAVNILADALSRAGKTGEPDRTTLRTAIENTSIDGLSGPIRLSPEQHSGLRPQALAILVENNGKWTTTH